MQHEEASSGELEASGAALVETSQHGNSTANPWKSEARQCDDIALAVWRQHCERHIALADQDTDDPIIAQNTIDVARQMVEAINDEQGKRQRAGYRMLPVDRGIPRETLDDLRSRVDLVALIKADDVRLRRSGRYWRGLCPFHDDRNPSLVVWPDDGYFRCFGCAANGDAVTWWQAMHSVGFVDAVTWLARAYGVPLPARSTIRPANSSGIKLLRRSS